MNPRELEVAVYGIINAGKSSLINALARRDVRPTGPIGGTTRDVTGVEWRVVESEGDGLPPCLPLPLGEGRGEGCGTPGDV